MTIGAWMQHLLGSEGAASGPYTHTLTPDPQDIEIDDELADVAEALDGYTISRFAISDDGTTLDIQALADDGSPLRRVAPYEFTGRRIDKLRFGS